MSLEFANGKRLLVLSCLVLVVITLSLRAGEMEPFGPPGPTMKPLFEIEPRRLIWGEMLSPTEPFHITEPGSYYLAENIDATDRWGIEISVSNVTIDLNGFALINGWGAGIRTDEYSYDIENIVIRDGTISGWDSHGIELNNYKSNNQVIHVIANDNGGIGIRSWGHIIDCTANDNGADGIYAAGLSVVRGCRAVGNGNNGIQVGGASTISNSVALANGANGIRLWGNVLATGNVCNQNTEAGIRASNMGNRIDGNHTMNNEIGIDVVLDGYYSLIIRNSAWGNSLVDYSIPIGNDHGPIGSATQSTSAWTNFDD